MDQTAWIEPEHVQVGINWSAQSGCMATVCARDQLTPTQPLVCERGSVTDLCELVVQSPDSVRVCAVG